MALQPNVAPAEGQPEPDDLGITAEQMTMLLVENESYKGIPPELLAFIRGPHLQMDPEVLAKGGLQEFMKQYREDLLGRSRFYLDKYKLFKASQPQQPQPFSWHGVEVAVEPSEGDEYVLVMEWAEATLNDEVRKKQIAGNDVAKVAHIARGVAESLQHMHEQG